MLSFHIPSVIYRADMVNDSNDEKKIYFGLTGATFKERCGNYTRGFKYQKYENSTELAKYIWQLKHNKISLSVKLTIITAKYGSPNPLFCKLYLTKEL